MRPTRDVILDRTWGASTRHGDTSCRNTVSALAPWVTLVQVPHSKEGDHNRQRLRRYQRSLVMNRLIKHFDRSTICIDHASLERMSPTTAVEYHVDSDGFPSRLQNLDWHQSLIILFRKFGSFKLRNAPPTKRGRTRTLANAYNVRLINSAAPLDPSAWAEYPHWTINLFRAVLQWNSADCEPHFCTVLLSSVEPVKQMTQQIRFPHPHLCMFPLRVLPNST